MEINKRHHWAFDNGLAGVSDRRTITVAASAGVLPENHVLKLLDGAPIREANSAALRVDPHAFEWHRKNIFLA
jgi:predicted restriction endonuclease